MKTPPTDATFSAVNTPDGLDVFDVTEQATHELAALTLPALTARELDAARDDTPVAGLLRDTATYEAAALSAELVDAEMSAVAAALRHWQAQRGMSLRALARVARQLVPASLTRGVTSSTLARWLSSPASLRVAHFAAVRATVAALGYTMYDVADVMTLARGRALQARYGAQLVDDAANETLARAQRRWDRQRELLAHFDALDDETQDVIVAQARGLALTRRAQTLGGARVAARHTTTQTTTRDDTARAEDALATILSAIDRFEQRALNARPAASPAARTRNTASGAAASGDSPNVSGARRARRRVSAG